MNMKTKLNVVMIFLGLVAVACGQTNEHGMTLQNLAAIEKADDGGALLLGACQDTGACTARDSDDDKWRALCEYFGLYGDGECQTFCPEDDDCFPPDNSCEGLSCGDTCGVIYCFMPPCPGMYCDENLECVVSMEPPVCDVEQCLAECPLGCPAPEYQICGEDGNLYCNECVMNCQGVEVAEDPSICGPVPQMCESDSDCEFGAEWCENGECVACNNSGMFCALYCEFGFVERNGCSICQCAEQDERCADKECGDICMHMACIPENPGPCPQGYCTAFGQCELSAERPACWF
jgi:hypothetical protein